MNNSESLNETEVKKAEKWNSIDDALKAMFSISAITKGSDVKQLINSSVSDLPGRRRETLNPSVEECQNASSSVNETDDNSIGAGRGRRLRELEKQFSRLQLDGKLHADLRTVVGPGFSNELIEHHFGYPSSSAHDGENSIDPEGGVFSDSEYEKSTCGQLTYEIGESEIMKRINSAGIPKALPKRKKKIPRCRNALILSLTQKKTGNEEETEKKTEGPLLKGPDIFLTSKSYSTAVSVPKCNSSPDGSTLFTADDFPAL